jgi:hypothetical protein
VIDAVTDCTVVRQCLSGGPGVTYDAATGAFSADLSGDAGNNLVLRPDGLFVPTGAATVATGCGLVGNGAGSTPVRVNTSPWAWPCNIDTNAGRVYCDSAGALRTDPPPRLTYTEDGITTTYADPAVPTGTNVTVRTDTLNIPNPDPCRGAVVIFEAEVDVDFDLPVGARAAAGIGGDEMQAFVNRGTATMADVHWQMTKVQRRTIPQGQASLAESLVVSMGQGAGGATYNRIATQMRAWIFNI